jgi:hypothetical protein
MILGVSMGAQCASPTLRLGGHIINGRGGASVLVQFIYSLGLTQIGIQ